MPAPDYDVIVAGAGAAVLAAGMDLLTDRPAGQAARCPAQAKAGVGDEYGNPATMPRPVARPPFHAARLRATAICRTGCDLRIDPEALVPGAAGRRVSGRRAAGETTGGMSGACHPSGGASIANAVMSGRIAGRSAAAAIWGGAR